MTVRAASPAIAFAVGTLGIALFSGMDAIMKGLVLAIGVYSTMLWRSFAGVALAGRRLCAQLEAVARAPGAAAACRARRV